MFDFKNSRYNRHEQMPEWGDARQAGLRNASVVVIGAGGVKSTLLLALASAGIGRILIIDNDRVELSNLNRQILYRESDIGDYKSKKACETLRKLNGDIIIDYSTEKVTSKNIKKLCLDFEIIVEGGDSPYARNLVNEFCLKYKKPFIHCSAQFGYGYVFAVIPSKKTACFACYFPKDHSRRKTTGAVPVTVLSTSVAGSLGAAEILKFFLGYKNKMFINKKLCFSSLLMSSEFTVERQKRRVDCSVCSLYYK